MTDTETAAPSIPKKARYKSPEQIQKRIAKLEKLIVEHECSYHRFDRGYHDAVIAGGDSVELARFKEEMDREWASITQLKSKKKRAGDRLATILTPVLIKTSDEDGSVPK